MFAQRLVGSIGTIISNYVVRFRLICRIISTLAFGSIVFIAGCSGGGSGSGTTVTGNICTSNENGLSNKLGVHRLMRFSITKSQNVIITANRTSGLTSSDPNLILYKNGIRVGSAESGNVNSESLTVGVSAGDYVLDVFEFKYAPEDGSTFETPAITCYDVGINYTAGSPKPEQTTPNKLLTNNVSKAAGSTSSCVGGDITVTGRITYDRVPHNTATNGLNYSGTTAAPVRGAVVESQCAGAMYDTAVTDNNGDYTLTASANDSNFVRVYAQTLDTSAPGTWNFQVVDNTNSGAQYVMDGTAFTSAVNLANHDLHAASGWDVSSSSYTSTRVAAPFAILDSVYTAFQKILSVDPSAVFPALKINWSIDNVQGFTNIDLAAGRIGTSFFSGSAIYILGKADSDLDEYDDHVIIHEWGHYFEHNFSRSDSIGGTHSLSNRLDIRLAFGEGFGNAFSGIASGDSVYRDASGINQSSGFGFDVNSNNCSNAGWYSECSVQALLYDFNTQLNFSALYAVLINEQRNTPAATSIFSFVKALRDNNAGSVTAIDSLLAGQNIDPITDIYGDSELTNNPGSLNQLPVYTQF